MEPNLSLLDRLGALRRVVAVLTFVALLAGITVPTMSDAQDQPPSGAAAGEVPGQSLGNQSDSDLWRAIRQGNPGMVTIPNQQAAVLIQSEGEDWRSIRNGPVSIYGATIMLGMVAFLAAFFTLRGRIRIEAGFSGRTITRFNLFERFCHWLTAISFIVLALTGLNLLYGRDVLIPVIGKDAFHVVANIGQFLHHYVAFPFMAGLVLVFILWARHNFLDKVDFVWMSQAGGLFTKGVHPPSKKFNFGQKIIFWVTILGGISLSLSGLQLLFPYEFPMFGATFAALNLIGFDLPAALTPLQEQQLAQIWHSTVALILIAVYIAHVYIGSVGMQGAFAAMGSGKVDINWAKEHHNLWVEDVQRKAADKTPAE